MQHPARTQTGAFEPTAGTEGAFRHEGKSSWPQRIDGSSTSWGHRTGIRPPVVPEAQAARASNEYINDPLQDPSKVAANWDLAGKGSAPDKQNGATGWSPRLMNVNWANNNVKHQQNGQNGCEKQGGDVPWPYCSVAYTADTDSQWMTLTADNPNECKGSSGTILNKKEIPSDLGVVVE